MIGKFPLALVLGLLLVLIFSCREGKSGHIPSSMIPPHAPVTRKPAPRFEEFSPRPGVVCWRSGRYDAKVVDCEFVPEECEGQPKPLEKMP